MAKKLFLGKYKSDENREPIYELGTNETYLKAFRLYGLRTTFKFNQPPAHIEEMEWLRMGFDKIVEKMKEGATDADYMGFTLKSLNLKSKESGYISIRPASQVTSELMWQIFGGIIQSNAESVTSSDTFQVHCTKIRLPVGSGGKRRSGLFNNFEEECHHRKGIITIKNNDNLCLPRAIVVARAHVKAKKDAAKKSNYALIRMNRRDRQTVKAQNLIAKSRVQIPQNGAGIPELERIQAHLKRYNITVYKYNTKGRSVYYCGENQDAQYNLNLLYCDGHYNVITSLTAVFACQHFCESCRVPFEHKGEHTCNSICQACKTISPPCKWQHRGVTCPLCNRVFKNQICFIAHQGDVCKRIKECTDCHKVIRNRKTKHVCGEMYCVICKDFKEANHQCYMKPDDGKPKLKDFLFIFFDLETRQDDEYSNDPASNVHKVNLCVSKQYCANCIDSPDSSCDTCSRRMHVFKDDPVSQFMTYVMNVRKSFKDVCVIAHHGSGFDYIFLFKHILEKTKFTPELIMRGTKMILMKIDNVRFVDSLCYFPMALSALPAAFDLPPEKKKGYFPHLFNTKDNQNYVGPMPPEEYYCPDSMFEKRYKDFKDWYDKQVTSNYTFDFQKELLEYCISDVEVLAKSCIKFRKLFCECIVDPFREATTIASACNLVFRRNYLKENTIGLIPKQGYRFVDNQSAIALQWLCWVEEQLGVRIQHAGRGREVKIGNLAVDGLEGNRVYEFQGCYWHGCPKCYPYKRNVPLPEDPSDSLQQRYDRTIQKIEKLKQSGEYEVIEMWECEFRKIKKEKKLEYLERHPMLNSLPLNPRDSFFGGRTGNAKVYHKCEDNEQIHYVDVCSLYPYVCKYAQFPIGHPTIHVGDGECRSLGMNAEGLVKCKVLPPTDIYHPVLPMKMHGKLMFVLCRTCGEREVPGE